MNRPEIEELESRPNLPPVAPKWMVNLTMFVWALGMSIVAFNLGG